MILKQFILRILGYKAYRLTTLEGSFTGILSRGPMFYGTNTLVIEETDFNGDIIKEKI